MLRSDFSKLESDIIEKLLQGLPSRLDYPESHSDMSRCVRNLMLKYKVTLRQKELVRLPEEGEFVKITINGSESMVPGVLSYKDIVLAAGKATGILWTVVYSDGQGGSGTVIPGQEINMFEGGRIEVVFTGSS